MGISNKLLQKICCPTCNGDLLSDELNMLQCDDCGKLFQIINGIPLFTNEKSAYDNLYNQIDFHKHPFGYNMDYATWRKGKINKEIVKYLEKGSVLDDGGGYGYLKEFLGKENTYYNIEYSYEILNYDTGHLKSVGNGEELPFKDATFDNIVSGDVLEHVYNKVKYLEETYRVLKPGGIFILNTPRTEWIESYKKSIWFWVPYLGHVTNRIKYMFRDKINLKTPEGVVDIPSNEVWLRNKLETIGYQIIVQKRTDNHLPGLSNKFWRKFADAFIDPEKMGHCTFFVCKKS
jgi:Methylase involved in ubiquinone/menaquinone biosynthesis